MEDNEVKLNFQIPPELKEKDIIFKVNKPKVKEENSKFRSFFIGGDSLKIDSKSVPISYLVVLLQEHGLSKTLPLKVQLGKEIQIVDIDWKPMSYFGPTAWYFNWNGVKCSIVGTGGYGGQTYIRIHDLTLGVGERILSEICCELLKRIPKPPARTLAIYTPKKNNRW